MFPDASEKVNFSTTSLKADGTFELNLAETIPDTPDKLYFLEKCYLIKFNYRIGEMLHIIQWTHPDTMYAVNRLSSRYYYPLRQPYKVSSTSYDINLADHTIPSCI